MNVHFKQTLNNIFIVAEEGGRVVYSKSSGCLGLTGPKKLGSFAFERLAKNLAAFLRQSNFYVLSVVLRSPLSKNIKVALRVLKLENFRILELKEQIAVSHNGLRPRKQRRV